MPKPQTKPQPTTDTQTTDALAARLTTLEGQVGILLKPTPETDPVASQSVSVLADRMMLLDTRLAKMETTMTDLQRTVAQLLDEPIPGPTPDPVPQPVPVPDPPQFDQWKARLLQMAAYHGAQFMVPNLSGADGLGLCYYDAAWIYASIGKFFGNTDYAAFRDKAIYFYRDGYCNVQPTPGGVSGIDVFPHGLYHHYKDTGDEASKTALLAIAAHSAFASWGEITAWLPPLNTSREAAYQLMSKLYARELGQDETGLIEILKDICLGHLKKWRDILDGTNATPSSDLQNNFEDVRSFMVGITCHALISYAERTPDPKITEDITATLNLLWDKQYDPTTKALAYTDRSIPTVGDRTPAPDVSMLVAPAYAWIGQRDRFDALFEGNLIGGWWDGQKQFNQAMRWAFEGLEYRKR